MSRVLSSVSEVPALFPPGEPIALSPERPSGFSIFVARAARRMKRRASTCLACERKFCPGCITSGQ
jgi:hypothetical protein